MKTKTTVTKWFAILSISFSLSSVGCVGGDLAGGFAAQDTGHASSDSLPPDPCVDAAEPERKRCIGVADFNISRVRQCNAAYDVSVRDCRRAMADAGVSLPEPEPKPALAPPKSYVDPKFAGAKW